MDIDGIDHLVLTVRDLEKTVAFYRALGVPAVQSEGRTSLQLGGSKINLHVVGHVIHPAAQVPTPGSGDFCLAVRASVDAIADALSAAGIESELGPVDRTGARGPMRSFYVRDPDANLVELASYPRS